MILKREGARLLYEELSIGDENRGGRYQFRDFPMAWVVQKRTLGPRFTKPTFSRAHESGQRPYKRWFGS